MSQPAAACCQCERRRRAASSWLRVRLEKLPFTDLGKETWSMAGELSLRLRRQGLLTPLIDVLIAALALEGGHEVYTLDEHFQRVPGLKLHATNG